jgi:hypothetical protein
MIIPFLTVTKKKSCSVCSKTKVMLTFFFDYEGVVCHQYAPQGQAMNQSLHLEVLRHHSDAVHHKRPQKWESDKWQIHCDKSEETNFERD